MAADGLDPARLRPTTRRGVAAAASQLSRGFDAVLAAGCVKALAHITGGGLPENVPRVLPDDCDAEIDLDSWPVPPLFQLVREVATRLDTHELYRTLNMGIGMVVVCAPGDVDTVRSAIDEPTWVIGRLTAHSDDGPRVHLR